MAIGSFAGAIGACLSRHRHRSNLGAGEFGGPIPPSCRQSFTERHRGRVITCVSDLPGRNMAYRFSAPVRGALLASLLCPVAPFHARAADSRFRAASPRSISNPCRGRQPDRRWSMRILSSQFRIGRRSASPFPVSEQDRVSLGQYPAITPDLSGACRFFVKVNRHLTFHGHYPHETRRFGAHHCGRRPVYFGDEP